MHDSLDLSTSTPWPAEAIPKHWIESLFKKMAFTYGTKLADQWRGTDTAGVKQHWALELGALTNAQLCAGVAALNTRPWPPTLPEFIAMCRPPVDPIVAFHEAAEQGARRDRGEPDTWSTPAIYWAWVRVGRREVATQPYAVLRTRWEAALIAELGKAEIEQVPAPAPQLPAPGKSATAPAKARELLARMKLKDQNTKPEGDGRKWARDVLARGDAASIHCVKIAQQALGMR
ncbi:hypothetical protein [Duganella aceris]|uniref:Uncharacterized protein n=1 Tax=Duganella aceris TaxID=2703883 RepID=A0ABX0FP68_9BURK|nr:hypothetical protein [Duganella aceris]NGZ86425.1 hypothetical protein [Duganella aceris]